MFQRLFSFKSTVEIHGGVLIKRGPRDQLTVEAAKLDAAHQLGRSSGLFRSPRLIRYTGSDTLEMEFIPEFKNIKLLAGYGNSANPYWSAIGQALAHIHLHLTPTNCISPPFPNEFSAAGSPRSWLHGDFNLANVGHVRNSTLPVIIDWSATPMLRSIVGTGPSYFDVSWMLRSLFLLPLYMRFPIGLEAKADRFLSAYCDATRMSPDFGILNHMTLKLAQLTIDKQASHGIRRYLYRQRMSQLLRYLNNVQRIQR